MQQAKRKQTRPPQQQRPPGHEARMRPRPESKMQEYRAAGRLNGQAALERTFRTNVIAMFHVVREALPHLQRGARIINTTSVTAYRGSPHLIDYASTKGAIVAFTRSLALALVERGIRVSAVAPGPVLTPLIPASFSPGEVAEFGAKVPLGRPVILEPHTSQRSAPCREEARTSTRTSRNARPSTSRKASSSAALVAKRPNAVRGRP